MSNQELVNECEALMILLLVEDMAAFADLIIRLLAYAQKSVDQLRCS